jgi:hypothetical protein
MNKADNFKVGGGCICIKEQSCFTKNQWYLITKVNDNSMTLIDDDNDSYHISTNDLRNFAPFANEPLPHSRERIAYAMGAVIEMNCNGTWSIVKGPTFNRLNLYRVKTPDTETPNQKSIRILETKIKEMSIELNKLKEQS